MKYLVIGGAGFIGSNLTERLVKTGNQVVIFDNLSRKGADKNLHWLLRNYSKNIIFINKD